VTVRPERETLETLWAHIKPEPKMGGSYVVTRNRIPAELVGEVLAALAAAPDAWVAVTCPNCINGEDGTACAAWCPNAAPDARLAEAPPAEVLAHWQEIATDWRFSDEFLGICVRRHWPRNYDLAAAREGTRSGGDAT
jgi:hypothetical protein